MFEYIFRMAIGVAMCVFLIFGNGRSFRKTLPIDPSGSYGAATYFAHANGAAVLYLIIYLCGLSIGYFYSKLAFWIAGGLLVALFIVDLVGFARSMGQIKKNVEKATNTELVQQGASMLAIIRSARLVQLSFILMLSLFLFLRFS